MGSLPAACCPLPANGSKSLQQLNLAGVIQIVRGDARDQRKVADRAAARRDREVARRQVARCISPSTATSALSAATLVSRGRAIQFDPSSGNDPRAPPVSRRNAMYFQYAAWTISSQILCRERPGRHAASRGVRPRMEPRRLVPCQDFLS